MRSVLKRVGRLPPARCNWLLAIVADPNPGVRASAMRKQGTFSCLSNNEWASELG